MTTDDDETAVKVHYGDKVVTVGERFDKIEKLQVIEGIGILLLLGIHLPEIQPLITAISKISKLL